MTQPTNIKSRLITSNLIPASESKELKWLMLYVCIAYHYKVIFCGLLGKILGYTWICNTMIHGVTTNHWFEQLVYVPLLWYVFYRMIVVVFGPHEGEILGKSIRTKKVLALFFATMYTYSLGIHFTNTLEIYSRVYLDISSGPLYDQIYWIDEIMSHWIQFFFYFLFFAWLIVYDRLDRDDGSYVALFTGLLHGVERAVGVIEGDNANIAIFYGTWILIACFIRWKKHGNDFARVWKDFFFRHGLSFGISMPIGIFSYHLIFNGFVQPSSMGDTAWKVVVFGGAFILIGFTLAVAIDSLLSKKSKPST
jgi:hypothetical protein